jgi:hypothetical protein
MECPREPQSTLQCNSVASCMLRCNVLRCVAKCCATLENVATSCTVVDCVATWCVAVQRVCCNDVCRARACVAMSMLAQCTGRTDAPSATCGEADAGTSSGAKHDERSWRASVGQKGTKRVANRVSQVATQYTASQRSTPHCTAAQHAARLRPAARRALEDELLPHRLHPVAAVIQPDRRC